MPCRSSRTSARNHMKSRSNAMNHRSLSLGRVDLKYLQPLWLTFQESKDRRPFHQGERHLKAALTLRARFANFMGALLNKDMDFSVRQAMIQASLSGEQAH